METCQNCIYWNNEMSDRECRRHAPVARMVITTNIHERNTGAFPQTDYNCWCGDWKINPKGNQ